MADGTHRVAVECQQLNAGVGAGLVELQSKQVDLDGGRGRGRGREQGRMVGASQGQQGGVCGGGGGGGGEVLHG